MRPASGQLARHAIALAVTAVLAPAPARAYVRRHTDSGAGFSWRGTSCLPIVVYSSGFEDMTPDEVAVATAGAAEEWSHARNACTYLTLSVSQSDKPGPRALPAQEAAIVFRQDKWCRFLEDGSCSAVAMDLAMYTPRTLMLTGVTVGLTSGAIVESSVEVNSVDADWANLVLHPERQTQPPAVNDLQNALTHELGHFIGLDHNCDDGSVRDPIDNLGHPAPSCGADLPSSYRDATMWYDSQPGDLIKRTLSDDDILAVCEIYPTAKDPATCHVPDGTLPTIATREGCVCAVGAAPGGGAGVAVTGALLALALRLRRRRANP